VQPLDDDFARAVADAIIAAGWAPSVEERSEVDRVVIVTIDATGMSTGRLRSLLDTLTDK